MLRLITLLFVVVSLAGAENYAQLKESQNETEKNMELEKKYQEEYLTLFGSPFVYFVTDNESEVKTKVKAEDIKFVIYNAPAFGDVVSGNLSDPQFPPRNAYNETYETVFYIHGYLQRDKPEDYKYMAMRYAIRGKRINFVSVDWSKLFCPCVLGYWSTFNNAPQIAENIAEMVKRFISQGVDPKHIHMIGVGFGAHLAGLVGKKLEPKVDRITGLSPDGLYWIFMSKNGRLSKGDADFVDVIHTNMGVYGFPEPIGNVDFLPAGGRMQPVAANSSICPDLMSQLMGEIYYRESIDLGVSFIGKYSESYVDFKLRKALFNLPEVMGEYVTRQVEGNIYLEVNAQYPFGKGVAGAFFDESN